ncbi:MAG: ATP-binding protein, partial [Tistlia sp.]
AAAAHELGSPLATIAVVVRELERELSPGLAEDSPVRQDLDLLRGEAERCRQILAQLGERPEGMPAGRAQGRVGGGLGGDPEGDPAGAEDTPFHRLPLAGLVEAAALPFESEGKALEITYAAGLKPAEQPTVVRRADLVHGLGSLLQNALQFARSRVEVELAWDRETIRVAIRDDGPGFAPQILSDLGDPYVSTGRNDVRGGGRRDQTHMGLGVFIAQTLLARTGAALAFGNRPGGGAEVVISWQSDHLVASKAGRR